MSRRNPRGAFSEKNNPKQRPTLLAAAPALLACSAWGTGVQAASFGIGNPAACEASSLQKAVGSVEGNLTIRAAAANTGGSFMPDASQIGMAGLKPLTDVPDFCRVSAVMRPSSDSNINIEIWLPLQGWNGKFLSMGEAGLAGSINWGALAVGLQRGYASASTDGGHSDKEPWWPVNHREKIVDGGHRAKHLQTVAAKAVIEAYYSKGPAKSYHSGCSGGGRQGLMALQRYPEDFDGYVIGPPASNWTGQVSNWLMKTQLMSNPATAIPAAKGPAIKAAAVAQCDAVDGLEDGIISEPRKCTFNADALACPAGKDESNCLTSSQLTTLKAVLRGPVNSAGQALFPGDEPGTDMIAAAAPGWGKTFGLPTVGGMVYNNSNWDLNTYDFDLDARITQATVGSIYNATDPDLRVQKAKGIKVLHYHGWADQALSPQESVNYYEQVISRMGGVAETQSFYRLFMVPGMTHDRSYLAGSGCGGGDGPNHFGQLGVPAAGATAETDIIMALDRWVTEGVAPDRIIATKYKNNDAAQPVEMRRPLCPYPKVQKYVGSGDPKVVASFSCVDP